MPSVAPLLYPVINGVKHDWSSVDFSCFGAVPFFGLKALSYKQSLTPGKGYGTGPQKAFRTEGVHDADGSIELYKEDADSFLTALMAAPGNVGKGYLECTFDATVHYAPAGVPDIGVGGSRIITDVLFGCRLTTDEDSHTQGGDALTVKFDIDIMYFTRNGKLPMTAPLFKR